MPIFDLNCEQCGKAYEVICRYTEIGKQQCELCKGPLKPLPSTGTGFQLKGDGWYKGGFYPKRSGKN